MKKQLKLSALMVSILVISSVLAFSAVADETDNFGDEEIADGDVYWEGQELYVLVDSEDGESATAELREGPDEDFDKFQEISSDEDDGTEYVSFSTEDFEHGEYELTYPVEDDNGDIVDETVLFEVLEQSIDVETSEATVEQEGDDTETSFNISSERSSYELIVDSEDFDMEDFDVADDDVESGMQEVDGYDDEKYVVEVTSEDKELDVDFDGTDVGNYEFTFDVLDTDASSDTSVEVIEQGEIHAEFVESTITQNEGDVAEIELELGNTDVATVMLSDEDEEYVAEMEVEDNEGEGYVTIYYDTFKAGQDDPDVVTTDNDENDVTMVSETNIGEDGYHLVPHNYDLTVSVDGEDKDLGTLQLVDRESIDANSYALYQDADVEDVDSLDYMKETNDVAENDYVVLEFEANGIYSTLTDDTTASDIAGEDSEYADEYGYYVTVEETEQSDRFGDIDEVDISSGELIVDDENEKFYVLMEATEDDEATDDDFRLDNEYTATFNMTSENSYVSEDEEDDEEHNLSTAFTVDEAFIEYEAENEDEVLELINSEDYELVAETNLAPENEEQFTITYEGENSFIKSESTTVSEDSLFISEFDLSELDVDNELTIEANEYADEYEGVIVEETAEEYEIEVTNEDGDVLDQAVEVEIDGEEYESTNGIVVVEDLESEELDITITSNGFETKESTIDASDETEFTYTLTEEETETYDLNVNVENDDEEAVEDAVVKVNDQEETGASVNFELESDDYEVIVNADGYEESVSTVELTENDELNITLTEDSSDRVPGFGFIVAVVALLASALLAYSRN